MSTAGPNGVGSVGTSNVIGTIDWTGALNVFAPDGVYATAVLNSSEVSYYLHGASFGFSIPPGATINGIQLDILCQGTGTALIQDHSIRLYQGGVLTGTDKAVGTTWPVFGAEAYRSYGGPADLWGASWGPSDINDVTFGAAICAINNAPSGGIAYVDYFRITVTFTSTNQVSQQVTVARPPQAAYDWTQKPD